VGYTLLVIPTLLTTLAAALAAAPAPVAPALARDWAALSARAKAAGSRLPAFSAEELERLARGDAVRRRATTPSGGDGVIAAVYTPLAPEALWVTIQDDKHDKLVAGLVEAEAPGSTPADKLLYQRLDLPWPFEDRQWVIRIRNHAGVYGGTGGQVWERRWSLADPALAPDPSPTGVWVPENAGGWLLVEAGGGTVVVYEVRTVIGGAFPEDTATRWSLVTVEGMLRHIVARAAGIDAHYGAGHAPFYRPDGSAIAPGSLGRRPRQEGGVAGETLVSPAP
jgi:hypothetical protein